MGIEFLCTDQQPDMTPQDALSILTCMNTNSLILLIQDKVPRMCVILHSLEEQDSDSDPDYGDNGFGAGRGKLVKAMKSATPGNTAVGPRKFREASSW